MDNSTQQNLIESNENGPDYHYLEDDYDSDDEPRYMYIINAILNGTARLNILLPSATILSFTIFVPLVTKDGQCTALNHWLTAFFLSLLSASCIFFMLTDSFRTATGRLFYGVATISGIWTFIGGGRTRKKPCVPSDYRLRWSDLFYVSLSSIAFLTFAASHNDVLDCYNVSVSRKVSNVIPLVVGFVISVLFVVFPSKRRGIGYPFLLQRDALYSRC